MPQVCSALGDYMGVKIHRCMGGKSVKDSIRALKSGASPQVALQMPCITLESAVSARHRLDSACDAHVTPCFVLFATFWMLASSGIHVISGTPGRAPWLIDMWHGELMHATASLLF